MRGGKLEWEQEGLREEGGIGGREGGKRKNKGERREERREGGGKEKGREEGEGEEGRRERMEAKRIEVSSEEERKRG